jgi:hypothetical protein
VPRGGAIEAVSAARVGQLDVLKRDEALDEERGGDDEVIAR